MFGLASVFRLKLVLFSLKGRFLEKLDDSFRHFPLSSVKRRRKSISSFMGCSVWFESSDSLSGMFN